MKIIANLICLDSAPELPDLLASLKGNIDAVVAIDGGSEDNTVEILESWGRDNAVPVTCQVNPWPDDFAAQRNRCLDVTRETYGVAADDDIWILMIDTDDTLVEFDRIFAEEAARKAGVGGLMCRMDNSNGFFHVLQFFKLTPESKWENPIHEYIVMPGPRGLPPAGKLTIKRGYSSRHIKDPERNVRIGRRFVESSPDNSRGRFYLARDLIECGVLPKQSRMAEAEGHLRAYLAMTTNFVEQDRYARLMLVRLLCDSGRVAEAREILLLSLARDPDNRSCYESLARISADKEGAIWQRLAASAEGSCVMPYATRLPEKVCH